MFDSQGLRRKFTVPSQDENIPFGYLFCSFKFRPSVF